MWQNVCHSFLLFSTEEITVADGDWLAARKHFHTLCFQVETVVEKV